MSMIQVENLTFAYESCYDNVFENVSFRLDADWRLGFIGRNGRGKTTFLNLLLGKYEYKGVIRSSVNFVYFPYEVSQPELPTQSVLHEICPTAQDWEFERELSLLEVDANALRRPFQTLSNGERTKVLLAALFLNKNRFLLIDEPTNHLDAKGRELVAAYLQRKRGFILVSHDRCFLDACVDHILSLNRSNIEVQSGNFSSWYENFLRRQAFETTQNDRLQKDISRMQAAARSTADWSDKAESTKRHISGDAAKDKGFIGHKAAKMMKRSKTLQDRQQHAVEQKSQLLRNVESAENLKIHPLTYFADRLASFGGVQPIYDGNALGKPISFAVNRGDRVALEGANGSGKSSLLKLLTGEPIAHSGAIAIGSGLKISYVPQDATFLQGNLAELARESTIDESLFKTILRKLDFQRVQFEKDMRDFSQGQKKKVLIAKSLCEQAHLYVWDEPLNYIDIYSRLQIEQLLQRFKPTLIFVEHDRAFREEIATKTIVL